MDVQTPSPVQVGLEMSRRTRIGCVMLLAIVLIGGYIGFSVLRTHGEESSRKAINAIYQLAMTDDFPSMEPLASKSVVSTLQKADSLNGRVQSFSVLQIGTEPFGRPSGSRVSVRRNGKDYVADVALLDSIHVSVIVEYSKEDWDAQRFDRGVRVIEKEGAK